MFSLPNIFKFNGAYPKLPTDNRQFIDGDIIVTDNEVFVYAANCFSKLANVDLFNPPNCDTAAQPASKKEMKVYKCPNCNNSIHYLQAKCEFCGTKISWI